MNEERHGYDPDGELLDADIVAQVRGGDPDAYGVLWARHARAARAFARQIGRSNDVDDIVSEAFAKILSAILGGGGPTSAFRAYLLSTVRRLSIDNGRSTYGQVVLTDMIEDLDPRMAPDEGSRYLERMEYGAALRAWQSLPDEPRELLWHTLIQEETAASLADELGTSPNGVSSRSRRARERLRQAFLQEHVLDSADDQCQLVRTHLGAYQRGGLASRVVRLVREHLAGCDGCRRAESEVADVNSRLRHATRPGRTD
ncbi:sigma-70 family RNA polymerase sigma factor [Jatrophihabitans telluris]|uniref:Sigma-70 family RNA polymerase sigma factor n=1 Tax=Jatrophihabitans telluris TaxID=2038343 RepID=A0ABY4QY32_9ACTN|nr:sigma-70 family RNA polymerase sigma factor [Jatrophihabitans telluris]UQX88172.1 sigma-70 family RNA polymerase sigma factor [Jatrophihabitans telluris]